MITGADVLEQY